VEATTADGLVKFLRNVESEAGWLNRVKITYRPYVCPFTELLGMVKPGERVIDVGSGSGQFCLLLARFARPSWVGGIEISERLVHNARELFANAGIAVPHAFEKYDGAHFPEALTAADRVFLVDVLHHVPPAHQAQFLVDLQWAMKPGAMLVLKDIDGASPLAFCNKLHDLLFAGEIGSEIPAPRLCEMAEQAGFTICSEAHKRMWWYPHFTLVLQK
jgi:cyclopropane fatty-acyl-phospholipid synthase-like methyltransferase